MRNVSIDELIDGPVEAPEKPFSMDISNVAAGVSISWLMQAFRMDRYTVRKKMAECQPIKFGRGNTPIYDFVQASAYLVKPKVDLKDFLKTIKPEEMPNDLQKEYWDALLKRQKYEVQAGQLWRTADVLETFGEVFKRIKTSMQLWVDDIEQKEGLTATQRKILIAMVDNLQESIHRQLLDMAETRSTPSSAAHTVDPESDDDV